MIPRVHILDSIRTALGRAPVVVITGPRQCGKTTLARELLSSDSVNYFDLEDPTSLARLEEPMTALGPLEGLVVIDEVQRRPDLFPVLRVLVDRQPSPARFLILGSASGELERQSSESLAGRVERLDIAGFTLDEVGASHLETLWLRGGLPRAFLASSEVDSMAWRDQFIQTLLERDLPQWGVRVSATALRRLWTVIAHYHGQTWNAAEAARALDVSQPTVRGYLDMLTDARVVRQLQPHFANLKKRQVKSPKVYVRDSGLLHGLLGIGEPKALLEHPKVGASWEGFAIEQVIATEPHDDAAFWATHQGAEIDLVLYRDGALFGVECKRTDAPKITPSIRVALEDLGLERIAVVYPGTKRYRLSDRVEAVPLQGIAGRPGELFGPIDPSGRTR
ncbi:MAG: ATP-binding protein [Coriobacteriia bacterium]|nr:ATP-binding protein [Coriobacteriia bacterium]